MGDLLNIQNALIGAVSALSGGIVYLFFWFRDRYKRMEQIVEAKEKDLAKMQARLVELERLVGWFKVCSFPRCPYGKIREIILEEEDREESEERRTEAGKTAADLLHAAQQERLHDPRLSPSDPNAPPLFA